MEAVVTAQKVYETHCKGKCGAVVWSSLGAPSKPHYLELILCPKCGRDNSVGPTFKQRFTIALKKLSRLRKVGERHWYLRHGPLWYFKVERERHGRA